MQKLFLQASSRCNVRECRPACHSFFLPSLLRNWVIILGYLPCCTVVFVFGYISFCSLHVKRSQFLVETGESKRLCEVKLLMGQNPGMTDRIMLYGSLHVAVFKQSFMTNWEILDFHVRKFEDSFSVVDCFATDNSSSLKEVQWDMRFVSPRQRDVDVMRYLLCFCSQPWRCRQY